VEEFVPHKFSLNDPRRAAISAIKSPPTTPLARNSIETNGRFVTRSIAIAATRPTSRLTRLWKPLFLRPKMKSQFLPETTGTGALRASINRILRSGGRNCRGSSLRIRTANAAGSRNGNANRRGKIPEDGFASSVAGA
jgi:hypothetical protein